MRVTLAALVISEFFRDSCAQDILIFVDNVFRLLQAGSEVSSLLGECPQLLDISQHWLLKWVSSKSAS